MILSLKEMGHPQNADGIQITTDNITTHGILTSTMQAKLSKAYDMQCHWIKDRIRQKQFNSSGLKASLTWPIILQNIFP